MQLEGVSLRNHLTWLDVSINYNDIGANDKKMCLIDISEIFIGKNHPKFCGTL